jgi:hypothetical protein
MLRKGETSFFRRTAQGEPVLRPPAKDAANGTQSEHGQELIDFRELSLFELHGVAAGTLPLETKQVRQPIGAISF